MSFLIEQSLLTLHPLFIIVKNCVPLHPGGTTLYKLYNMCRPIWQGFLRRFGLKTGIHFAHFGLESGMVFEGTTGAYERIYRFNSK